VSGDFSGETAAFYARFRRGYPPAFTGLLARALGLGGADVVADVGCGTGQLTLALASRVRAVAGMDPEPDMPALARQAAADEGGHNVAWVMRTDRDLPALGSLFGTLEQWLGVRLASYYGTDAASPEGYQAAMRAGGFTGVHEQSLDYTARLSFGELIGGLYSAMPGHLLPPPAERAAFAGHIRHAIGGGAELAEQVHVAALIGYTPP